MSLYTPDLQNTDILLRYALHHASDTTPNMDMLVGWNPTAGTGGVFHRCA